MKEIEEGNKLIAFFMGATYVPEWTNTVYKTPTPTFVYEGISPPTPTSCKNWDVASLSYHTDWGWIMPVVAKIKKDKHDPSQMFMGTTWERDIQYRSVCDTPIYTPIETVWAKVVEFIKWYNQQAK